MEQNENKINIENNNNHEIKEKEDIIEQEKLVLRKEKRIALSELNIKPSLLSKKSQGTLEAHINGFRFTTNKKCQM